MAHNAKAVALVVAALACGLFGSWLFALAGAPQQLWFWRDVLGLM